MTFELWFVATLTVAVVWTIAYVVRVETREQRLTRDQVDRAIATQRTRTDKVGLDRHSSLCVPGHCRCGLDREVTA